MSLGAPTDDGPVAVPFTILTGWLGAGKTSVLNRILGARHGKRVAVLVNELGRVAIDTKLIIRRGNDVLELAGGCVCCKVDAKSDLWDGIAEVITRNRPEYVVLETTGIAEPAAILEGMHRVPPHVAVTAAGIICVVDAAAGGVAVETRHEATEQAQSADRLLLSKLDMATPTALRRTHELLDRLNPDAERASFAMNDEGDVALSHWLLAPTLGEPAKSALGRRATQLPQLVDPAVHAHGGHTHHSQLLAASFVDERPLLPERLLATLASLGPQLVRAKGFVRLVNVAGELGGGYVEFAGHGVTLTPCPLPARSELVIIGDNLDEAALRRALWAAGSGGSLVG